MIAQSKSNGSYVYSYSDREKFNILFDSYGKALQYKAYSILKDNGWAEDAVQQAFMKIFHHMDKIGDPHSEGSRCYLYTILVNSCFSMLKQNKKYFPMDNYMMQTDYGTKMVRQDDTVDHIICEELLSDVRKIPEIYSNLLILHAVYSYSLQEISEMLELKPATVRKRVQRGRQMLERLKERYCN